MPAFAWDKGLDYNETKKKLLAEIKKRRKETTMRSTKQLAYLIILLTQLENGSRVGEAIEAIYKISKNFDVEVDVPVEKRKDGMLRKIFLPKEIRKEDILRIAGFIIQEYEQKGKKRLVVRISNFARKNLGFNTHALRYAFITKQAKEGTPAQIIAKMTMHARLDYILYYTQQQKAEEILKNLPR